MSGAQKRPGWADIVRKYPVYIPYIRYKWYLAGAVYGIWGCVVPYIRRTYTEYGSRRGINLYGILGISSLWGPTLPGAAKRVALLDPSHRKFEFGVVRLAPQPSPVPSTSNSTLGSARSVIAGGDHSSPAMMTASDDYDAPVFTSEVGVTSPSVS